MKILLSYSKFHFDPSKNPTSQKYWHSSAGILARNLYRILSEIGKITYIDGNEIDSVRGKEFDLFVGTHYKFNEILRVCKINKSILFAVNMHPAERNRILLSFLLKESLNLKALAGWDLMNFLSIDQSINSADYIICAGNIRTYNTYIKRGIPKQKIKMINYGAEYISQIINKKKSVPEFIYLTSEIGLRKGFDIVYSLFTQPQILDRKFHLKIMGLPTNSFYEQKLNRFLKILGNKAEHYGWVDAGNLKYRRIVANSDFFIFPSLEEGQAGTAVEALDSGLIPLVSRNCGIDFAPFGNLELSTNSEINRNIMLKALSLPKGEINRWKMKTKEYYGLFHADFRSSLKEAVIGAVKNDLYPKISVILPIFNKERTIKPLIKLLHRALIQYGNCELHIYFDGCQDQTEDIVRNFYKDKKQYPVTFYVTANIFETKTNNLGLKKSSGKYAVILQDDNFIYDRNIFFEAVSILEKSPKIAILGALAGVNFYPKDMKNLTGKGQIVVNEHEVYWRQDENTDPELKHKVFETDACMRGPLILRKSFLEKYGYLDESYAPYYMDDIDLCFRAKSEGFKVFAFLSDTINTSGSISVYQGDKWKIWEKVIKENPERFYSRWQPSKIKDYLKLERITIDENLINKIYKISALLMVKKAKKVTDIFSLCKNLLFKLIRNFFLLFNSSYSFQISNLAWKTRHDWTIEQLKKLPKGSTVLDVGAGSAPFKSYLNHCRYTSQDFCQTPNLNYGKIDVISDIRSIPLPDNSFDVILCTEVLEHVPYPIEAVQEMSRLLKSGGKLILTSPLGSGLHQIPYHFYGGFTKFWYLKFLPENKLTVDSIEYSGGLYWHIIELIWRSHGILEALYKKSPLFIPLVKVIQLFIYNIPSVFFAELEHIKKIEDFTTNYLVLATKTDSGQKEKKRPKK
ncbi:MAG: type 11 methyltransferase [Candidatus Gottesmanbacteria bacterium GW2011_GWA2_43_14]|uniref:Type 11 methyltransferase n=1 Tax=Candidatus Gottesmanbacteria bacterium GW2011_GWA2_43_14 TaxID=1618443 RepID=A0A0G1DM51_9BACT|nr:MAG: type 11 methyltransferase [Candidatus Gottesmanbacteria bacterium GW2011_GWA2_43_14]